MDHTLQSLLGTMASDKGMERKRAREILVLMGEKAEPQVRALLDEANKKVRWEAAKTLAAMVEPASLPAFLTLLGDHASDLRWIAADGLINLGPRSVVPLLESLLTATPVKGQGEMAARVFRELSSNNEVLAEILAPVLDALKEPDPAILSPRVSRALSDISTVTGELPPLS